jgi:hypothetical protein
LRCTTKANSGKDLLDTLKTALGWLHHSGHLHCLWCTKCKTELKHFQHAQQTAFFPAPGKHVGTIASTITATATNIGFFAVNRERTANFCLFPT